MHVTTSQPSVMFVPDARDTKPLRDAFARFATGVTVVTAASQAGPVAMTANSFTSVSLSPPLVLWSIATASRRHAAFADADHYAIHVLGAEQREFCDLFAKDGLALAKTPHSLNAENVPVLEGCLARFECARTAVHPAGDHSLIVGEVLRAGLRSGPALAFFNAKLTELPGR